MTCRLWAINSWGVGGVGLAGCSEISRMDWGQWTWISPELHLSTYLGQVFMADSYCFRKQHNESMLVKYTPGGSQVQAGLKYQFRWKLGCQMFNCLRCGWARPGVQDGMFRESDQTPFVNSAVNKASICDSLHTAWRFLPAKCIFSTSFQRYYQVLRCLVLAPKDKMFSRGKMKV